MNQWNFERISVHFGLFALFLILALPRMGWAEGWRGIIPLHSTQRDVIEKLGISPRDGTGSYDLETEHVSFTYQRQNQVCGKKNETFDVPVGTVLRIIVSPHAYVFLSNLRLNLTEFEKQQTDVAVFRRVHEIGISHGTRGLTLYTDGNIVRNIRYFPSSEDEKNFACPPREEILRGNDG